MEKENKKARDDAKKEYNDTVRVAKIEFGCVSVHQLTFFVGSGGVRP